MWTTRASKETGFTLVELLVVVLVLGVLAGVAVPAYLGQREKASYAATKAHIRNLVPDLIATREAAQKTLGDQTTWCSACNCLTPPPLPVKDPAFATSACGSRWLADVTVVSTGSGAPLDATKALFTDGWGYPIMLDTNEGEVSWNCGTASDWVWSAGPDHRFNTSPRGGGDDYLYYLTPGGFCTTP